MSSNILPTSIKPQASTNQRSSRDIRKSGASAKKYFGMIIMPSEDTKTKNRVKKKLFKDFSQGYSLKGLSILQNYIDNNRQV